ncbi:MAG: type II toxin-antitoxin system PemK/MazF family toxin [Acidithiobacillales bacterium]
MTCDVWDVVVVPFPFSERAATKRRPALVLSRKPFNAAGHTVLAMITTQAHRPWPGDTPVHDLSAAGLPLPCIVRLKLFTLDNRLILRRIGALSPSDRRRLSDALNRQLF